MGVSVYYRAIPSNSDFFRRLQRDEAFALLVSSSFSWAYGLFDTFDMNPVELNNYLDEMVKENLEAFGDEWAADEIIADFRTALRKTRKAHPGVEKRIAVLEKTSIVIEQQLIDYFSEQNRNTVNELVSDLMFGDQVLTPHLQISSQESLNLISTSLVQSGATILRPLTPKKLFSSEDNAMFRDDFKQLRDLYLACAKHEEAIAVGVYG